MFQSMVGVTVYLDDINDNVPVFSHPVYFGSVDESSSEHTPTKIVLVSVPTPYKVVPV